jgi:S-adenosyl-L-methionine hydrolase (adenosine-forming)
MSAPVITLLTDYGLKDGFAGTCHAVIASICPEARVIDLTHGIPRHDVRAGALLLRAALPYAPAGVHMAVIDPDVGAERRAVALRVAFEDRLLVGPDNGLLMLAAEALGGVVEAVDIGRSPFRLLPVSATFHGRDIFAPVAARLAAGASMGEAGDPYDPAGLVTLSLPRPMQAGGGIVAHVMYIDTYGNVQLNVSHEDLAGVGLRLGRPVLVRAGAAQHEAWYGRTFADVEPGRLLVYEDAQRTLALAVSRGSAAGRIGLSVGDTVSLGPD